MVEKHIFKLLFKHNSLVLPNFGGFTKTTKSASVHPVKHTFTPPSQIITFNENLKKDDGLLLNALIKSGLTKTKAEQAIKDFVAEIKAAMKVKKPFLIDKVGKFYINAGGKLQFDVAHDANFNEDSFGLPELESRPVIKDDKNIKFRKKTEDRKPIKKDRECKKSSKTWVFLLIIILLLASSAGFLYMRDGGAALSKLGINPMDWFKRVPVVVVEDTTEAIDSTTLAAADSTVMDSSVLDTIEVTEEKSTPSSDILTELTGRYYVICGGFSVVQNAITFRDELVQKGYPNAKIMEPKGIKPLHRVSIDDFATMREGIAKTKEENPNFGNTLWVLKY